MFDASGNHIVPVGFRVEVSRGRFFTLAHAQNVVVVEQVARLGGGGVGTDQARQLFGFLVQFVG